MKNNLYSPIGWINYSLVFIWNNNSIKIWQLNRKKNKGGLATDEPIHLTHKNVTSKILEIYIQR